MERSVVIQRLLDLYEAPRYLEIGVDQGTTFHSVHAAAKFGVDVKFAFDLAAATSDIKNHSASYYEMTSDQFFAKTDKSQERFDVIFIDGLHTFDQTLRDLLHASYALADGGIIVVDDVMPTTYRKPTTQTVPGWATSTGLYSLSKTISRISHTRPYLRITDRQFFGVLLERRP
jgi:hypothetical protein